MMSSFQKVDMPLLIASVIYCKKIGGSNTYPKENTITLTTMFKNMKVWLLFFLWSPIMSQMTPLQMQQKMGIGINLGNTLDAPMEGIWAPKAKEQLFAQFKQKNFSCVRIPIRWERHMLDKLPYTVNQTFFRRIHEVVDWSLSRDLVTIINTHHDTWFEKEFPESLPKFKSLWKQIANEFASKNELLLFEIYNEPHIFTAKNLNQMNSEILPIIRQSNPTRIVIFGGLSWMNPRWILKNPDTIQFPSNDTQIMLEVHNYDPWGYAGGKKPTIHDWGSDNDISTLNNWMHHISVWSKAKNVPIFYGEFGCTKEQEKGRYDWYAQHAADIKHYGFAAAVWADHHEFAMINRTTFTWDMKMLNALGKL